ncbi:type II toxin-antitoxin system MqsR family toxin [Cedecea lapagei]
MTAYHDHTLWHEVNRPVFNGQSLYIKLIVHSGVLIVSFKES